MFSYFHVRKRREIRLSSYYYLLMKLNRNICYQALIARDARFDGRFFVGVATTGVYCRPVCPAKTPNSQNCSFFPSAAAAESAGFRPCLRCRPEIAPGNSSIEANARLAHRAASLIEDGISDGLNLSELANQLGVTDRHLRRVLQKEFGVAPIKFAQTNRLLLAKRLLTDTNLAIIDVAMASGFSSVRRFNALMKEHYRMTPSSLRRKVVNSRDSGEITLQLGYRPPLSWEEMIAFFQVRAIKNMESIENGRYRRAVGVETTGHTYRGWIEVLHDQRRHVVKVRMDEALIRVIPQILARVRRFFDLSAHPLEIASVLGDLALEKPGLRVPGAFDGFEIAVRAILGQRITVKAACTLAGRLTEALGEPIQTPFQEIRRLFPSPQRIAENRVSSLVSLGIPSQKATSLIAIAQAIAKEEICLEPLCDTEEVLKTLMRFPGIGIWTAQYVAMRALAWPDAFPHTDYGVVKAMEEKSPSRVLAAAEKWRPWRAYATMHLWESLKGRSNE